MVIEKINILNFKNIEGAEVDFSSELNCFVGFNGSGKTNMLDAIYYLSITKSALGLSDNQCVRHGEDFFMLSGQYVSENSREGVVCSYKSRQGKVVKRNGKDYQRVGEHIGLIPVVLSSPSDTSLISDSGDERRRYLNAFLSQTVGGYLDLMVKYNNLIAQRNKILKSPMGMSEVLEVIDMQLVEIGTKIFDIRRDHVEQLAPLAQELYEDISGGREKVYVGYKSELLETPFEQLLKDAAQKDYIMGHTTVGIHRDDLKLSIEDLAIRKFGSQGQQKSLLLALKLAQAKLLYNERKVRPLLLLDDVFDKLDSDRVSNLLHVVAQPHFGQIFVTDSNKIRLESVLDKLSCECRLFNVDTGSFSII